MDVSLRPILTRLFLALSGHPSPELANPSPPPEIKAAEAKVMATVEMAKKELSEILLAAIDLHCVRPGDKINAVKQLALIEGWNAPENHQLEVHGLADRIDKVLRLSDIEVAKMLENDPFKAKQIT